MSRRSKPTELFDLNDREIDIVRCIANGLSNQEIADKFVFTLNTVRWYNKQIYSKLDVHSRTLLVSKARELGLLDLSPDASQAASINQIPPAATPFIGRDAEIATLREMLARPECRVITLVGSGGIGKTRLAMQVSRVAATDYQNGVVFVPLASISSSEFMISALALALNLKIRALGDITDQVLGYLSDKHLLLVMDNFEHVLDGVSLVRRIIETAPAVTVLVTSRERLNLQAEWLYDLGGLKLASDLDMFEEVESVALFLECAQRHSSRFGLSHEDRPWITRICETVDGMPLGIELAAAWVRALSIKEIAQEVSQSFDFLGTSIVDIPERHRSLRAVFDPSWNRLTSQERDVLRGLSVFQGGFTREAAQDVAGAKLLTLASLIDKSLLRYEQNGRYSMHEMIRQYAASHLDAAPEEAEEVRDRHYRYFGGLLEKTAHMLKHGEFGPALRQIDADIDNVHVSVARMIRLGDWICFLRGADGYGGYYTFGGRVQEGRRLGEQLIEGVKQFDPELIDPLAQITIGLGHLGVGWSAHRQADYLEADRHVKQAIAIFERLGQPKLSGEAWHLYARNLSRTGNNQATIDAAQRGLNHAIRGQDDWTHMALLVDIAGANINLGDYQEATHFLEEAMQLPSAANGTWGYYYVAYNQSLIAFERQDYEQAHKLAQYALETSEDPWFRALAIMVLAKVALVEGQADRALNLYNTMAQMSYDIGERWGELRASIGIGMTALVQGKIESASKNFRDAISGSWEVRQLDLLLFGLVQAARLFLAQGCSDFAVDVLHSVIGHQLVTASTLNEASELLKSLPPNGAAPHAVREAALNVVVENVCQKLNTLP